MNELIITQNNNTLVDARSLAELGQIADQVAAGSVFADYRSRKADNTIRRQDADLALFADYLAEVGHAVDAAALATTPEAWAGTTWGLVEGFVRWQLGKGYAVGSVNVRLSTVKTFAALAAKAGTIDPQALVLIRSVSGYKGKEGKRIDSQREAAEIPTRIGHKKTPILIGRDEAQALKRDHQDTPVGRRDRVLFCLLVDHGLRVSEVAGLNVSDFDLTARQMRFYRVKVDKTQTHDLTPDTYKAVKSYMDQDAPPVGPLFRGSRKGGRLGRPGWAIQKITERVRVLGRKIADVNNLSPHDLRHYWATTAARLGTPIDKLMTAGGWSNPTTPLTRYIEPARIANEGVKLQ